MAYTTWLGQSSVAAEWTLLASCTLVVMFCASALQSIAGLGSFVGFLRDSKSYVNGIIYKAANPIFKIRILTKQLTMVNPTMDRKLAKYAPSMGLAPFMASTLGKQVFHLSDRSIHMVTALDTKSVFHHEFINKHNLEAMLCRSATAISEDLQKVPDHATVYVGRWIFGLAASANASALCGPMNPWSLDAEFTEQFQILGENLENLYLPFPWLTARKGYKARAVVLSKLRNFHHQYRKTRIDSPLHRINSIAVFDSNWENNTDYYMVDLIIGLATITTLSTLSVWLIRHLLASTNLYEKVLNEISMLAQHGDQDSPESDTTLEVGDIRETCPILVASWYEVLRLHMTAIARQATNEFEVYLPSGSRAAFVQKNDLLLLPMCTSNLDERLWGPEAARFRPERFMLEDGKLSTSLTRKVAAFGVAGNLCPGRFYGFATAMSIIISSLLSFEVHTTDDVPFAYPAAARGFNGGFERYTDDQQVKLVRKRPSFTIKYMGNLHQL